MRVFSNEFQDGQRLPDSSAYASENRSPSLSWSEIPDGTTEFAVICDDPDAPGGSWIHWVIYGIPASITTLQEGFPKDTESSTVAGLKQGTNGFGKIGYDGPHPPPGRPHRYIFTVYALSEALNLAAGVNSVALENSMKGKILAQTSITGMYSR